LIIDLTELGEEGGVKTKITDFKNRGEELVKLNDMLDQFKKQGITT
jgi:hypothetical protein